MKSQTDIESKFIELCKEQDKKTQSLFGYLIGEIMVLAWVLGIEKYFGDLLLKRKPYKKGEKRKDHYEMGLKSIGWLQKRGQR